MESRTYQAAEPIYVSSEGRMVYPGEPFTVPANTPTGSSWLNENGEPLDEKDRVAKPKAADAGEFGDGYDKLAFDDVKAIATGRKIPTTGKAREALIDAIRAANAEG